MHPLDLLDQRGSQRGNQAICASCGGELDIGSWPFCKSRSNPLGHASTMERNAQHFDPVVVFRKPDGSYSIPGRDKSTPPGCERVELRTLREVRQFENLQQHNDHIQWERKCEEDARVFG
ncbi:MAG: hypothetical protein ACRD22_12180, partial [Terriglobia bacterium]